MAEEKHLQASKRERRELANAARIQCGQPLLPNISPAPPHASPNQLSTLIIRDTSKQPVAQPIPHGHPPIHAKPADTSHDDEARLQAGEVIILDLGSTPPNGIPSTLMLLERCIGMALNVQELQQVQKAGTRVAC